jgi:hypothetical protein
MATTDRTVGSAALPESGLNMAVRLQQTLNCATYNQGANDIAMLIPVPSGTFIDKVVADVQTAEGGTLTFDVGTFDSDMVAINADSFLAGKDGNANAVYVGDGADVAGYLFEADGYIGITCKNAADAALIVVTALGWDFN